MTRKPEKFVEEMNSINSNVEIIGTYTKAIECVKVRCKKCGKIWEPKAYSLLAGKGCPHCSAIEGAKKGTGRTKTKTTIEFTEQLHKVNPNINVLDNYVNGKQNVQCHCLRCGHEWQAKPYSLLQGHGCPVCVKTGTSFMEQFILKSFCKILGDKAVLSRDKSLIQMELDIYIPEKKVAIEPGNWFLHQSSLARDAQKRNLCNQKGVTLITIYDKYPLNKELPFDSNCFVFNGDYAHENHCHIKVLVQALMKILQLPCCFTEEDWLDIEKEAYESSRTIKEKEFMKRLSEKNPTIQVCGEYRGKNSKIKVKCSKCLYEWTTTPERLLSGDGCKKCGVKKAHAKMLKSQDEFQKEVNDANPNIDIIGQYMGRHNKVAVRCKICGYEWQARASSLLRGSNHKGAKAIHKKV